MTSWRHWSPSTGKLSDLSGAPSGRHALHAPALMRPGDSLVSPASSNRSRLPQWQRARAASQGGTLAFRPLAVLLCSRFTSLKGSSVDNLFIHSLTQQTRSRAIFNRSNIKRNRRTGKGFSQNGPGLTPGLMLCCLHNLQQNTSSL